jgi:hypothetical protein
LLPICYLKAISQNRVANYIKQVPDIPSEFGAGEAIRTPDPNLGKVEVTLFLKITGHSGTFRDVDFP